MYSNLKFFRSWVYVAKGTHAKWLTGLCKDQMEQTAHLQFAIIAVLELMPRAVTFTTPATWAVTITVARIAKSEAATVI